MSQIINFDKNGRDKLLLGVKTLAKVVKSTLGPGGRNCIFNVGAGTFVTKDGVSCALKVHPEDPIEAMGADLIREASKKTAHIAGDGTTTSTLLTEAIAEEGCKMLASGLNAVSLQRGIMSAAKTICNYIRENVKQPCTDEKLKHVALVSTNWDTEIADLISSALITVGPNGSVTVGDSHTSESTVQYMDGLQIDRGFMSHYFVNDQVKTRVVFERPLILLSEKKITNNAMLKPILSAAYQYGKGERPLLIIAPDVEQEALTTLVINKLKGIMNVCAIKCPGFGERQKDQMGDLEAALGGTYFSNIISRGFETLKLEDFASCERVVIDRDTTTFIAGAGSEENIKNRITHLTDILNNNPESWQARLLKERIAKLSGGVAVVYVGASTEAEMHERQDRVDDAICATRAALEGGIIPGGGATLAKLSKAKLNYETGDYSFNIGVEIVRKSLTAPLRQLLVNAGIDSADMIINKVIKKPIDIGFNIKTGKFANLIVDGVIDPVNVTCAALENAASIAGLILTTDCVICGTNIEEKK